MVEPESSEVELFISKENFVVVSHLTYFEATVQIRGVTEGGIIKRKEAKSILKDMAQLIYSKPVVFRQLSGSIFDTAMTQHSAAKEYCRSLDRLHLAAMESLDITRLMTHDTRQAAAARELGYEVISPGLG